MPLQRAPRLTWRPILSPDVAGVTRPRTVALLPERTLSVRWRTLMCGFCAARVVGSVVDCARAVSAPVHAIAKQSAPAAGRTTFRGVKETSLGARPGCLRKPTARAGARA